MQPPSATGCVTLQYSLAVFLCLLISAWSSSAKEYLVQPTDSCPASARMCHDTLTSYLQNTSAYFTGGAVFSLLPGIHSLHERVDKSAIVIRNTRDLTLRGPSEGRAVIKCSGSVGLVFVNISGLCLEGITVENCGVELTRSFLSESINSLVLGHGPAIRVGLLLSLITNFTLYGVNVHNSTGYGMLAANLVGTTNISSANFSRNNFQALYDPLCTETLSQHCKGGNLLLLFTDFQSVCPEMPQTHTVGIRHSTFKLGVDLGEVHMLSSKNRADPTQFLGGAGVGIVMAQSTYRVTATIENCTLAENAAYIGSNLYMSIFDHADNCSIVINQSRIQFGNNIHGSRTKVDTSFTVGRFTLATGFFLAYGLLPAVQFNEVTCSTSQKFQNNILRLEDCDISYNRATLTTAGLVYVWVRKAIEHLMGISIEGSSFHDNQGDGAFAIFEISNPKIAPPFKLLISNSTFRSHEYPQRAGAVLTYTQEVVVLSTVRYSQISNCLFSNNVGSAIRAIDSAIFMHGTNRFIGNMAPVGAGLLLKEGSIIYLEPGSMTIFSNNRALTYGGAINSETDSYKCFYQVLTNSPEEYPQLVFQNNSAGSAGDAVYGNVDNCYQLENTIAFKEADSLFTNIATFDHSSNMSPISSKVYQLCLCPGPGHYANCTSSGIPSYSAYPGQTLTVAIAALGYTGSLGLGFTPAIINTDFVQNGTLISLAANQMIQQIHKGCSNLSYNFYATPQLVKISLIPIVERYFYAFYVNIMLEACPIGFQLSNGTLKQCICNSLIEQRGLSCDINTQTISRSRDLWIGLTNHTTQPEITVASCLPAYCAQNDIPVHLKSPDEQCSNNRSGILCGTCRDGFSLVIGTSRCLQCSNTSLLLLALFVVLGVLLIVLLSILNLTVASGMINALLFYVNVIKVTNLTRLSSEISFLFPFSLFVNWLNLDFRIETCFYDGFDVYAKSWLQYAFPFYLFFLMGVAITVSSRSMKLSKFLPRNIVPVFATVMLISYTKLLRTVLLPLPFSHLYTSSNSYYTVWRSDGGISYFGRYHAPLFMFSLLVFITVILPYVFLLTVHPFIQQLTSHEGTVMERFFTWIKHRTFHWKPIFDAYEAPFMNNHRYWTGLFLILRTIIILVGITYVSGPDVLTFAALTVISIVLLGMVLVFGIYEKKLTRALECAHFFNLALLEFITLIMVLTKSSETAQAAVLSASIAVSLLLFVCAACVQVCQKLQDKYPLLKQTNMEIRMKLTRKNRTDEDCVHTPAYREALMGTVTHTSVSLTDENSTTY